MTSTVALHLTESGLWACAQGRDWHGSADEFAGARIDTVDDGLVALDDRMSRVTDAWSSLFVTAVGAVGLSAPVESAAVSCPSHWGEPRRQALATAARRCADEVRVVPLAEICLLYTSPSPRD